ncbi:MAG: DUF4097 family beta strand repeat-containing protein [Kineosporiaceae bacterium]
MTAPPTPPTAPTPPIPARPLPYDPPPPEALASWNSVGAAPAYGPPSPPGSGAPPVPGGHGPGAAGPRRRWPWWAVVLTVLGAALVLAAVVVAVVLALAATATQEERGRVEAGDVRRVEITAEVGSITLDARDDPAGVTGDWWVRTAFGRGEVESAVADGVLTLRHECPEPSYGRCQLDLDLDLPAGTVVEVRMGAGEVTARGLEGPADVRTDAGSVRLAELRTDRVRAEVGIGDIHLGFVEPPRDVVARADVGDVEVRVPDDGTVYAVTTSSDIGDDSAQVPTDPSVARTIVATVEVGDARVRTGG